MAARPFGRAPTFPSPRRALLIGSAQLRRPDGASPDSPRAIHQRSARATSPRVPEESPNRDTRAQYHHRRRLRDGGVADEVVYHWAGRTNEEARLGIVGGVAEQSVEAVLQPRLGQSDEVCLPEDRQ